MGWGIDQRPCGDGHDWAIEAYERVGDAPWWHTELRVTSQLREMKQGVRTQMKDTPTGLIKHLSGSTANLMKVQKRGQGCDTWIRSEAYHDSQLHSMPGHNLRSVFELQSHTGLGGVPLAVATAAAAGAHMLCPTLLRCSPPHSMICVGDPPNIRE